MLLAMIIWYTVPIVQERSGMMGIAGIIFLWVLSGNLKDLVKHLSRMVPWGIMIVVLCFVVIEGIKPYGGIETVYFVVSTFLVFFPVVLFWYYKDRLTEKECKILAVLFFVCLLYGAINTYKVLLEYPLASRLMATSRGDEYSKMGAGGYGFAYLLMLSYPVLLYISKKEKNKVLKVLYVFMMVFFVLTLIKCEYTTCLLLLFLGIIIYISFNSNVLVNVIIWSIFVMCLIFGIGMDDIFMFLARLFEGTEVIAVRLRDVAGAFSNEGFDGMDSSRYELYIESVEGFINSPFVGTAYSFEMIKGGHSTVLDTLAVYGLVGFTAVVYAIVSGYKNIKKCVQDKKVYQLTILLFWVLSILNPTLYIYQLGIIVFFISPVILRKNSMVEEV